MKCQLQLQFHHEFVYLNDCCNIIFIIQQENGIRSGVGFSDNTDGGVCQGTVGHCGSQTSTDTRKTQI